jgi:hypothetical protein
MITDYLLKFPSKSIAEQFGVGNGFAQEVEGAIVSTLATHTYALHEIGAHNDADYWVLFRDLVGIPVPPEADPFIFWCSSWTVTDDAGSEISIPRPEFNPDVPSVFWA